MGLIASSPTNFIVKDFKVFPQASTHLTWDRLSNDDVRQDYAYTMDYDITRTTAGNGVNPLYLTAHLRTVIGYLLYRNEDTDFDPLTDGELIADCSILGSTADSFHDNEADINQLYYYKLCALIELLSGSTYYEFNTLPSFYEEFLYLNFDTQVSDSKDVYKKDGISKYILPINSGRLVALSIKTNPSLNIGNIIAKPTINDNYFFSNELDTSINASKSFDSKLVSFLNSDFEFTKNDKLGVDIYGMNGSLPKYTNINIGLIYLIDNIDMVATDLTQKYDFLRLSVSANLYEELRPSFGFIEYKLADNDGYIIGMSASLDNDVTTGNILIKPVINSLELSSSLLDLNLNPTDKEKSTNLLNKNINFFFSKGNKLGILIDTSNDFFPVNKLKVELYVLYTTI